jgi:Tfp pilus assembly protein PilF
METPGGTGPAPRFSPLDAAAHDELRRIARDCHARGDLEQATSMQRKVLASGPNDATDMMFMALLLYSGRAVPEAIRVLREGVSRFPAEPSIWENLAVLLIASGQPEAAVNACREALALGSASPNVHDALCEALTQLGRFAEAVAAGRIALEAKHRVFGGRDPLVPLPHGPPPPFDVNRPEQNVIAYVLWGAAPRYLVPLMENVRILPHLFPGWSIRVYHDSSVAHDYVANLGRMGVQCRRMILGPGQPGHRRLLWRFEVINDPSVQRFLIRDADAVLSVKERVAVDAWLSSRHYFHVMRDWYSHTDLILAGMWGGIGGILPPPSDLVRAWTRWRVEGDHIDQDILSDTIWPTIRASVLIHDSVFTGTLGGLPFPPYGAPSPGSYIGQNAFQHFTPPDAGAA